MNWREALSAAQAVVASLPRRLNWNPKTKGDKSPGVEQPRRAFASDPGAWKLHRMNPLPGEITLAAKPTTVTAGSLGLDYREMPRPISWAFARPPVPAKDPRHPDFSRVLPNSVVLTTEPSIDVALDAAASGHALIKAADSWPSQLREAEESAWKKVTPQRGATMSWFVQAQGPGAGSALPPEFVRCLEHAAAVTIRAGLASTLEPTTDPIDTNSGFPLFQAGLPGKMIGSLFGRSGLTAAIMLREAEWASPAYGLPTQAALAFGLSGRSGTLGKATPFLQYAGHGRWTELGEWRGFAQRNRVVQMGSAALNLGIAPIYDVWVAGSKAVRGQWFGAGKPTPGSDPAPAGWFEYDSDLTGLDLSVSAALQDALAAALHKAVGPGRSALHAAIDVHRLTGRLPLITPSWDLNDSTCALVNARSGVHSGQKATSREDTLYSIAANLYALLLQGFDALAYPNAPDFQLYNMGDDTRLNTARPLDAEAFVAAYASLGLKVKLAGGVTFLSKYEGRVGDAVWTNVPIAGRVVQQTLFNEHEAVGRWGRLVAPVGLAARAAGHEPWPQALKDATWAAIREAHWLQEEGLAGHVSLQACVDAIKAGPYQERLVAAAVEANAVEKAWLGAELRAGDHSPMGAFLRQLLAAQTAQLESGQVAFRAWQTHGMVKLAPSRARHYLVAGWHAAKRGRRALNRLGLELLKEAPCPVVAHNLVLADALSEPDESTTTQED